MNYGSSLILVYDYFHNAWTKYDGIQAHAMTTITDLTEEEQLYTGDFNLGVIYKQDTGNNDDGNAIDAYYQTKWYRFPDIKASAKVFRLLRVFATEEGSWSLTIDAKNDFAADTQSYTLSLTSSAAVWDTGLWDSAIWGGDTILVGRFHPELRESFFQLKFSNDGTDEPFTVYGWQMFIEPQDII